MINWKGSTKFTIRLLIWRFYILLIPFHDDISSTSLQSSLRDTLLPSKYTEVFVLREYYGTTEFLFEASSYLLSVGLEKLGGLFCRCAHVTKIHSASFQFLILTSENETKWVFRIDYPINYSYSCDYDMSEIAEIKLYQSDISFLPLWLSGLQFDWLSVLLRHK